MELLDLTQHSSSVSLASCLGPKSLFYCPNSSTLLSSKTSMLDVISSCTKKKVQFIKSTLENLVKAGVGNLIRCVDPLAHSPNLKMS